MAPSNPMQHDAPLPRRTFHLDVGDGHRLHVEEYGAPNGRPAVVLHGGPGAGCGPALARFFDLERYRVVLFDQRGAGRSVPAAGLEANTTWDLVSDIEKLRAHLDISSWVVFGGSWGSTLALTYAALHRERVAGLILRGVFLLRDEELDWFYRGGTRRFFPEAYAHLIAPLAPDERDDPIAAYYNVLTAPDAGRALAYAVRWTRYELATSRLLSRRVADIAAPPRFSLAVARIETHYFVNRGFFEHDGWLLNALAAVRGLPCTIVQGRYDMVCPPYTAHQVRDALGPVRFVLCDDAGHASSEPSIDAALRAATAELDGELG